MPTLPVTSTVQALRSVFTSRWLVGGRSGLRNLSGPGDHEIRSASDIVETQQAHAGTRETHELFFCVDRLNGALRGSPGRSGRPNRQFCQAGLRNLLLDIRFMSFTSDRGPWAYDKLETPVSFQSVLHCEGVVPSQLRKAR